MAEGASTFFRHFGVTAETPDHALLCRLGEAFSRLPYENVTKLLKRNRLGSDPERRRLPLEVMTDHLQHGTGGTCFSLSALFAEVLEAAGFDYRHILCQLRGAKNRHCALLVELDGQPHLLDPGYLVFAPLPLVSGTRAPGEPWLEREPSGCFDLYSAGRWRYRFRTTPIEPRRLQPIWDESFSWPTMNDIFICSRRGAGYIMVQGTKLRVQHPRRKETRNLHENAAEIIEQELGIDRRLIQRAYELIAAQT